MSELLVILLVPFFIATAGYFILREVAEVFPAILRWWNDS